MPHDAAAQATTGELTGRVTDQTGQIVAGATVVARRSRPPDFSVRPPPTTPATSSSRSCRPGGTRVSAERQGFKKVVRENVDVLVGTRATLALELAVGAVTEAVTVNVGTPLVDTTRPTSAAS